MKMTAKDVKEITYVPLVTLFSVLGGLQQRVRRRLKPVTMCWYDALLNEVISVPALIRHTYIHLHPHTQNNKR